MTKKIVPLYTAPQARTLSDEEIDLIAKDFWRQNDPDLLRFARAVLREAAAKVCDEKHWDDHRMFADAIRALEKK